MVHVIVCIWFNSYRDRKVSVSVRIHSHSEAVLYHVMFHICGMVGAPSYPVDTPLVVRMEDRTPKPEIPTVFDRTM